MGTEAVRPLSRGILRALLFIGIPAVSSPIVEAAPKVFRVATIGPANFSYAKVMESCFRKFESESGGRLEVSTFYGGVLGDEPDLAEKFLYGQLEGIVAVVPGPAVERLVPELTVLGTPSLFHSREEVEAVRQELGDEFARYGRRRDIEILGWADLGFVNYLSKYPIRGQEDLLRMKTWVWEGEKIAKAAARIFGAPGVELPLGDVLEALRSGKLDTVYIQPFMALIFGWHTEARYIVDLDLAYVGAALLVHLDFFRSLPKDLARGVRDRVPECFEQVSDRAWEDNRRAYNLMIKSGVTPLTLPPEVRAPWEDLAESVPKEFVGRLYPAELVTAVRNVLKKVRQERKP